MELLIKVFFFYYLVLFLPQSIGLFHHYLELDLGVIPLSTNHIYQVLPAQVAVLTFGVFFYMMVVYWSGIIHASEKFFLVVLAATGGIAIFYLISWVIVFLPW